MSSRRRHRGHGHPDRTPVGFAEVDVGLGTSPELIVVPTDLTTAMREAGVERPVTYVLTRERVRPTNRWRADPGMAHRPRNSTCRSTQDGRRRRRRCALDQRASDAVLAELLGHHGPTATARLTGVPAAGGWAAADGDIETAWITPFNEVVGAALHAELVDPDAPLTLVPAARQLLARHRVRLTQGDQ